MKVFVRTIVVFIIQKVIRFILSGALTVVLYLQPGLAGAKASTNLVKNPGFEQDAADWTASGAPIIPIEKEKHTGKKALKVYNKIKSWGLAQQKIIIENNAVYRASVWVKIPEGKAQAQLVLEYTVADKNMRQTLAIAEVNATGWTQLNGQLNICESIQPEKSLIFATVNNSMNDYFLDDFALEKVSKGMPASVPGTQDSPVKAACDFFQSPNCALISECEAENTSGWKGVRCSISAEKGSRTGGTGKYILKVAASGQWGEAHTILKLKTGKSYILEAYIKSDIESKVSLLILDNERAQCLYRIAPYAARPSWEKVILQFTPKIENPCLSLCAADANNTVYLDDLSLRELSGAANSEEVKLSDDDYYVIEKSTGIIIDGNGRDFGWVDNLHGWHAPQYLNFGFNNSNQFFKASDKWRGGNDLSGRISLKIDSDFLYIYGEIIDDTPMAPVGNSIWNGDFIELFISWTGHELESRSWLPGDCQILLLPGDKNSGAKASIFILYNNDKGQKTEIKPSGCEITSKESSLSIQEKPSPGYVIEAKLALNLFPHYNTGRKGYINFNIAVGDIDNLRNFNKCYLKGTINSHVSVEKYYIGFLQEKRPISKKSFSIGNGAKEYPIPAGFDNADAPAVNKGIWDMAHSVKKRTAGRESICLNGIWAIQTYADDPPYIDDAAWKYIAIPDDPLNNFWHTVTPYFQIASNELRVDSEFITDQKTQRCRALFREFIIPAEWKNDNVFLEIPANGTVVKCKIFLDKIMVAAGDETSGPLIDISKHVSCGNPLKLLIIVQGTAGKQYWAKNKFPYPLYTGDIWLHRISKTAYISACDFIKTSLIDKSISFNIDVFMNIKSQDLSLNIDIFEPKANALALRIPPFQLKECAIGSSQRVISSSWPSPRLWSAEDPFLYKAIISVRDKNGTPIDTIERRFGFREIRIEGRNLLVNGKITHLKIMHATVGWDFKTYQYFKSRGFNAILFFGNPIPEYMMNWFDELGLYFMPHIGSFYVGKLFENVSDRSPERKKWMIMCRNHPSIAVWLANISVTGDQDGWTYWNYHKVGTDYFPGESQKQQFVMEENKKCLDFFREADPTRPIMHYNGGNFPPIPNTMNHSDFGMHIQECAGNAETWSKTTNAKPFILSESWTTAGTGLNHYLFRHPNTSGWAGTYCKNRETADFFLFVEQASQYFGEDAYKWAEPARTYLPDENLLSTTTRCWDRPRESVISGNGYWYFDRQNLCEIALHSLGIGEHARADRGYGLSGRNWHARNYTLPDTILYCSKEQRNKQPRNPYSNFYQPRDFLKYRMNYDIKPNIKDFLQPSAPDFAFGLKDIASIPKQEHPFSRQYRDALSPVLVYIGGGPETDNFRYKDHAFYAGENAVKHAVLINDLEKNIFLNVQWKVADKCSVIGNGAFSALLVPGDIKKIPISFIVPDVNERKEYILELEAQDKANRIIYRDTFAMEFYPRLSSSLEIALNCYDIEGTTKGILKLLGIKAQDVNNSKELPDSGIIVIGRNSLSDFLKNHPAASLSKKISGGLRVLILEQNQSSVFGPWQQEIRLRDQFIKMPYHPILSGLMNKNFRNWHGCASLTTAYSEPETASEYMPHLQFQNYGTWGSEGIVSTLPIRRPQHGNVRTILAGGFDQEWASLMEFHHGKGLLLVSQLDICGRTLPEPAANEILLNIVKYMSSFTPIDYGSIACLCSDKNRKILSRFQPEITPDKEKAKLLIVDASKENTQIKKQWLETQVKKEGKTMLVLWPDENEDLAWIDPEIRLSKFQFPDRFKSFYKAIVSDEEKNIGSFLGITSEDLFFKFYRTEIPIITKTPGTGKIYFNGLIAVINMEKGKVIICQINPEQHKGERSFVKAVRFWSNFLTSNKVRLNWDLPLSTNPLELSMRTWKFKTDPDNRGEADGWMSSAINDSSWKNIAIGKSWESQGITEENPKTDNPPRTSYNGYAWYRINVEIPPEYRDMDLYLQIQVVSGEDHAWFNGRMIGKTIMAQEGSYNYRKCCRNYSIPKELITPAGKANTIAIRVNNIIGYGGLTKVPVRIMAREIPNNTPLFPMEQDYMLNDPYRFEMY